MQVEPDTRDRIRQHSIHLIPGEIKAYDPLIDAIGDSRFVLIGEASHGTHEFYCERAEITKRLILEKGFVGVAVEADFPDAIRVNRYVSGRSDDPDAKASLNGFVRFPSWMWRNKDVVNFIEWLRSFNEGLPADRRIGFFGLDLYSLFGSIDAVLKYLDDVDPAAARRARVRYACFDHFGEDTQSYGYAAGLGYAESCEDAVVEQLLELHRHASELAQRDGHVAEDEFFFAEQNARLIKNAERYYRVMFRSDISSWNLRDRHMFETLVALDEHLSRRLRRPKIVVWEHNSHLGDASATEMGRRGEWNVGQLTRKQYADEAFLIGFTTDHGTVTASTDWGGNAERKRVRPALEGSYERLFHEIAEDRSLLLLRQNAELLKAIPNNMLERAIGVIYRPDTERQSHYFRADLSRQLDAVIHIDETRALEPLERSSEWETGESPETFPSGI